MAIKTNYKRFEFDNEEHVNIKLLCININGVTVINPKTLTSLLIKGETYTAVSKCIIDKKLFYRLKGFSWIFPENCFKVIPSFEEKRIELNL